MAPRDLPQILYTNVYSIVGNLHGMCLGSHKLRARVTTKFSKREKIILLNFFQLILYRTFGMLIIPIVFGKRMITSSNASAHQCIRLHVHEFVMYAISPRS